MKQKILIPIVLLFLILLIPLYQLGGTKKQAPPSPVNGYLDLRNWSFEKDGPVSLKGEWEFYFNTFVNPGEFDRVDPEQRSYISLPSNRESIQATKPFEENRFYGTMRLVIDMPEDERIYGIISDIVLSSYKIYINDIFMDQVGKVGTNKASSKPYYQITESYFKPQNHRVEIVYHTSDFYFGDVAISTPEIGLAEQISMTSKLHVGKDLFLFGILLTMGAYHMGLYWIRKKDKSPLYFGVFCLMFGFRVLIVSQRILPSVYPLNFMIYTKLACLTVVAGGFAFYAYLYSTFENLFPKWFFKVNFGLASCGMLFIAFAPPSLLDIGIISHAVGALMLLPYAAYKLVQGVSRGIRYTFWVLLGFVCITFASINDFIYEITLVNRAAMIPVGVAVFVMLQAYALSAKFSNAFFHVEKLSIENEQFLNELKNVNSNLENIVEERTTDLKVALSEMDLMSKTDYLTKLPNRRSIYHKMDLLIQKEQFFYISIMDIDDFKTVNDTYGHHAGDLILQNLSQKLTCFLGDRGFIGRWGGEEFLILFYESDDHMVLDFSNQVRKEIESLHHPCIDGVVTVTMGITQYLENLPLDSIIAKADQALYEGKENGRNQCVLYPM